MSELYLLAASLLPVSMPPPPLPPDWLEMGGNFNPVQQESVVQARILESVAVVAQPEGTTPEMTAGEDLARLSLPQLTGPTPSSGPQLYFQRLTALKMGKLHSRLNPSSFYPAWKNVFQQPTHEQWKQLLIQEASAIAKGQGNNRLNIMVGDSLTLWFPTENLPKSAFWLNQGISGENSGQILKRLSALEKTRPSTIYVMAGVNDLRQGVSDERILYNIRQILRHLKKDHPKVEIVIQSILPTRLASIPNTRINGLNQAIIQIAQDEGAYYLNLNPLFRDTDGQLKRDLTTDGLHLSRQGYNVWRTALYQTEGTMAFNP